MSPLIPLLLTACTPTQTPEEALWEGKNPGECIDGADNDGDGAFDCFDTDCGGAPDCAVEDTIEDTGEAIDTAEEAAIALAEARQDAWSELVESGEGWVNYYGVPGLAFAVILDGELAYATGLGSTQYGGSIPVTTDTVFRWNSVSKMHTAMAVLQQVEAGNLDLHAPITDLLPDISLSRGADPDELTLHRMMTHTTAMEDVWDTSCNISEEMFWNTASPNLLAEPGAVFNYSNTGWSLAGRALEVATGQDYAEYMKASILEPAGMETATFVPAEAVDGSYSIGYDGDFYTLDRHDCEFLRPATLLHGNVVDLATMAEVLLAGGDGLLSDLTPLTQEQQLTGYTFSTHHGYGMYNWSIDGVDVLSHSGGGAGHSSYFLIAPDQGFGVVAVTNTAYFNAGNIALEAAERFLSFPGVAEEEYFTDPDTWTEYEGTYEDLLYTGTISVSLQDRYLYARFVDGANTDRRLYQVARDEFFYISNGYNYIRFVDGEDGTPRFFANRYFVGTRSDAPGASPPPLSPEEVQSHIQRDARAEPLPPGHPWMP